MASSERLNQGVEVDTVGSFPDARPNPSLAENETNLAAVTDLSVMRTPQTLPNPESLQGVTDHPVIVFPGPFVQYDNDDPIDLSDKNPMRGPLRKALIMVIAEGDRVTRKDISTWLKARGMTPPDEEELTKQLEIISWRIGSKKSRLITDSGHGQERTWGVIQGHKLVPRIANSKDIAAQRGKLHPKYDSTKSARRKK